MDLKVFNIHTWRFDIQKWSLPRLDALLFASLLITLFFIPLHEKLKAGGFLVSLTLWLIMVISQRSQRVWIPDLGRYFLLFVGVALVSAVFSEYHNRATRGALDAFRYTVFFLILINTVDSFQKIKWLVLALMGGIVIGDAFGIYRYYYYNPHRIQILSIGEQNSVAQVLSFILALFLGLMLTLRSMYIFKSVLISVSCLTALTLVLTYSRAIWLAVLTVLITYFLVKKTWKTAAVLIVLIVSVSMGMSYSPRFRGDIVSLQEPLAAPSITTRILWWKESLNIIKDRPVLGIGLKTYGLEQVGVKYHLTNSAHGHNIFINVAAELGILGLTALCLWLTFLLRTLLQIYPRMKTDFNQGLWLAGLGCFIALIVGGLAHPMLGSESSLTLMTVLGLMLAGYRIENGVQGLDSSISASESLPHGRETTYSRRLGELSILKRLRSRLVLYL